MDECPLCERPIPKSQRDSHHLVPRVKGGRDTEYLHRICHRQIHALFSESELAKKYNTVDSLLENDEVKKFVRWVRGRPTDFLDGPKMSRKLRR